MNKSASNVVVVDFKNRNARTGISSADSASDRSGTSEAIGSVASECVKVLDFPASQLRIRLEEIPDYDLHAKGFFHNLFRSGDVSVLVDDGDDAFEGAHLEITEPDEWETFRISLDDFISYVHPKWAVSDPNERQEFFLEAMYAFGLWFSYFPKDELDEVSVTAVNDSNFETFFPELMNVTKGSEGGFPTVAYFSGKSLPSDLEMELKPDFFKDPSKITVLHLMMYVLDTFNQEGWEVPEDSTLFIMKRPFVREGSVMVPMRLIRPAVLRSIDRMESDNRKISVVGAVRDESEIIRKFFLSYLLPELAD